MNRSARRRSGPFQHSSSCPQPSYVGHPSRQAAVFQIPSVLWSYRTPRGRTAFSVQPFCAIHPGHIDSCGACLCPTIMMGQAPSRATRPCSQRLRRRCFAPPTRPRCIRALHDISFLHSLSSSGMKRGIRFASLAAPVLVNPLLTPHSGTLDSLLSHWPLNPPASSV